MYMLDHPLQWKSRLFIPISLRTLHSITAKPDLQNRVQTSKRKSPNLRTWCAVTNFLPSRITASEHSVGLLQNTHTAAVLVHANAGGDTQSAHPQNSCQSFSWAQTLRASSCSPKLKKLVSVTYPQRSLRHWVWNYFGTYELLIRSIKAVL